MKEKKELKNRDAAPEGDYPYGNGMTSADLGRKCRICECDGWYDYNGNNSCDATRGDDRTKTCDHGLLNH